MVFHHACEISLVFAMTPSTSGIPFCVIQVVYTLSQEYRFCITVRVSITVDGFFANGDVFFVGHFVPNVDSSAGRDRGQNHQTKE